MRRTSALVAVGIVSIALVGCSQGSAYEDAAGLRDAVVAAGAACENAAPPSTPLREGIDSLECGDLSLAVFDDPGIIDRNLGKANQIAAITGVEQSARIRGGNWTVSGSGAADLAESLNGTVVTPSAADAEHLSLDDALKQAREITAQDSPLDGAVVVWSLGLSIEDEYAGTLTSDETTSIRERATELANQILSYGPGDSQMGEASATSIHDVAIEFDRALESLPR